MRTVTLQSLILRAWQRAGNDASDIANVPSRTKTMLVAAANERIADAWEWADWPELCRVESRTVQGDGTDGYYIDYEQLGQVAMGEVFAVYRDNPDTHVSPRTLPYVVRGDAVRFPDTADIPATVYVRFRTRPTVYTADNLSGVVPTVLARAVGLQLTADLLEEDGQLDKASLMESKAEADLVTQRDKYIFQQGQQPMWTASVRRY